MKPFELQGIRDLKIAVKFDEQKKPITTVQFSTTSTPREIATLLALYQEQPIEVTIASPQMHLFNPDQSEEEGNQQ